MWRCRAHCCTAGRAGWWHAPAANVAGPCMRAAPSGARARAHQAEALPPCTLTCARAPSGDALPCTLPYTLPCSRARQVVTLLLHQQRVGEALGQFRGHMAAFRRPPLPLPAGAAAAHAGWLARQYAVVGELLATRVDPLLLPRQARRG